MAINTRWDNRDKTAILLEFETEWSFSDLEQAIQRVDDLLTTVPHMVDVLVDLEGAKIPKDVMNMAKLLLGGGNSNGGGTGGDARSNEGRRIVVGANSAIRQGYQLIQKMFSNQLKSREILFAEDLTTARAILGDLRRA
jgi:hypothetical protein